VDIESVTTKNPADLVPAGQAFVDYMKSKGLPKVGLYSGEHFYNNNGLANIKSDFEWIARYGANDGNPHVEPVLADELWQFTSVGHVDGISTNVDMNLVTGGTLEYFTGKPILMKPIEVPPPAPAASAPIVDNPIGKVRVVASGLRIRSGAGTNFPVVGTAVQGKIYDLFEVAPPQWHRIGVNQWVWGEGGKYLELNPQTAPAPKPAPTGVYHKVVSGDTVSELAVKYGSTVAQIKAWNGLADVGKISIGQNLKVSEGGAPAPKPAAPQPVYHTVVAGDAVSKLAAHYGSTQAQIKAWNGLKDVDVIRIGQKLRVK
jgi:LysM repeat protein